MRLQICLRAVAEILWEWLSSATTASLKCLHVRTCSEAEGVRGWKPLLQNACCIA